jgi:hypothetical protein
MSQRIVSAWAIILWLGSASAAPAPDAARAIIERAVKAHGGEEALARIQADRVKFKGSLVLRGHSVPFVDETTMQLPSRYKHLIEINDGTTKKTILYIINGDKMYVTVDGQTVKPDAATLTEIRNGMELQRAARLLPLLKDKSYQLSVSDEIKINDRPAVGVRVSGRGRQEMRLHFDKEFGLLVRGEIQLDDGKGKKIRQHYFFGNFKEIGGYKRYTKVRAYRDGKSIMEAEMLDAKILDKVDETEFAKP